MEPTQLQAPFGERSAESATPFLRWAGGKQTFVARYGNLFPNVEGRYIEPFLGGGSVFFYLTRAKGLPFTASLGDINGQLMSCYSGVKEDPNHVADELEGIIGKFERSEDPSEYYYRQRDLHNDQSTSYSAARFIFLNRTCWNGLFRVNAKGEFNVPFGRPPKNRIRTFPDRQELIAISDALSQSVLRVSSWESLCESAQEGDFVFLDPPYYSDCSGTAKYNIKPFDEEDHARLAATLLDLDRAGVMYVLTNSAEYEMINLYEELGLRTLEISAPRAINSNVNKRSSISELLVTNIEEIDQEAIDFSW